nr:PREDICTED: rasGAP-activating-like protein 1 [Apteryx mantelli mantelli]
MRVAFKQLRQRVEERFPSAEHEEVRYISISGFLFLRFFAPAILTPKLFNLREQHADPRTSRTLLLLAKARGPGRDGHSAEADPNTLFRSNSLASKSMEQFMKVVGMPYLHEVLKPIVDRIFEEKKYVELDPCKMELSCSRRISFKGSLSEAQVRESSLELLKGYLGDIIEAIVGSVDKCPLVMRVAFKQLRQRVEERFPSAEHEEVRYISISGFLFLRFFAPAILTPKLFNLREQHADPRTSRTLLLLAKARGPGRDGHSVVAQDGSGQLRTTYLRCKAAGGGGGARGQRGAGAAR